MLNVNGTLFFATNDTKSGTGLWKSNGTEAGTVKISDTAPTLGMVQINGTVFFSSNRLWKSDGTPAGTTPLGNVTYVSDLTVVGNTLFFVALGSTGYELWKSDGSDAGTIRVKDLRPDWTGNYFYELTAVNDLLFFVTDQQSAGGYVSDLWRSDGSEAGTFRVSANMKAGPRSLTGANGKLLFGGYTPESGIELWKSDGSMATTHMLKDINCAKRSDVPEDHCRGDDWPAYASHLRS